jgi:hypothetical protein
LSQAFHAFFDRAMATPPLPLPFCFSWACMRKVISSQNLCFPQARFLVQGRCLLDNSTYVLLWSQTL